MICGVYSLCSMGLKNVYKEIRIFKEMGKNKVNTTFAIK